MEDCKGAKRNLKVSLEITREEISTTSTDEEDNDAGDDSDHSSAASQGQHLAAEAEVDSGKVASSDAVVAAEDDSMGGP